MHARRGRVATITRRRVNKPPPGLYVHTLARAPLDGGSWAGAVGYWAGAMQPAGILDYNPLRRAAVLPIRPAARLLLKGHCSIRQLFVRHGGAFEVGG